MTKVNCIEVRDVSFSYNGTPVLENITFAVEEGEYLGIIGPNGGGKTTLFKIILGLLKPATGEARILILDEPDVGVDVTSQEKFYTFIEDLNSNLGITVLLISHDIDVVAHQTKTVLCLNRKLVCHGSPKKFISEEYMQELYGKKVKFILHGH